MVIESMLPYTLFGIAYVATLGANSPVTILFLSVYVMFTVSATIQLFDLPYHSMLMIVL